LGGFLAGLAFFPDLAFFGATWARCRATLAFLVGFGFCSAATAAWAVPASSVIVVMWSLLCAVITAVVTWITPVRRESKAILPGIGDGEGSAMKSDQARWV
jgi:hypothetical protein